MGMSSGWTVKTDGSSGSGCQAMWTQRPPGMSSRVSPGVLTPGAESTFTPSSSENVGPVIVGSVVGAGVSGGSVVVTVAVLVGSVEVGGSVAGSVVVGAVDVVGGSVVSAPDVAG